MQQIAVLPRWSCFHNGTCLSGQDNTVVPSSKHVKTPCCAGNYCSVQGAHVNATLTHGHIWSLHYTILLLAITLSQSNTTTSTILPQYLVNLTTNTMARGTAYHVCIATAVLLAVIFSSLLYAHQLSSGLQPATSLRHHARDVVALGSGIEVLPPTLNTSNADFLEQHEIRDDTAELLTVGSDSPLLKPQEKVIVPSEYKKAKEKGELLLCYMKGEASPGGKGVSVWNSVEQLDQWGWKREVEVADDSKDYSHVVSKVCTDADMPHGCC